MKDLKSSILTAAGWNIFICLLVSFFKIFIQNPLHPTEFNKCIVIFNRTALIYAILLGVYFYFEDEIKLANYKHSSLIFKIINFIIQISMVISMYLI